MNCMSYGCISIPDYIWNGISEDGAEWSKEFKYEMDV